MPPHTPSSLLLRLSLPPPPSPLLLNKSNLPGTALGTQQEQYRVIIISWKSLWSDRTAYFTQLNVNSKARAAKTKATSGFPIFRTEKSSFFRGFAVYCYYYYLNLFKYVAFRNIFFFFHTNPYDDISKISQHCQRGCL